MNAAQCCTLVFPAGFALKDPLCAYWQWTVDGSGKEKSNTRQLDVISTVTKTAEQYKISISFHYYAFDAVIPDDFKSVMVTMRNPNGETATTTLMAQLTDPGPLYRGLRWQAKLL
ncbi:hypothetical protein C8Q74DRAFT_1369652 [Fomes fomentarius]|nr:hypothetical protein C8Q74DRAFT_1369652 [Fomes fomentarius]